MINKNQTNDFALFSIEHIHDVLKIDIAKMNDAILEHLKAKEDLIRVVGEYLIQAGGKRIRPMLTIISSRLFGHMDESVLLLASAVEFIHAATLLHDDVVDDGKVRRSKPTANVVWGDKTSILVGDFLFSQAFKLMVSSGSLAALDSLSRTSAIIAEGEVAQLVKMNNRSMISQDEYDEIIHAKTAELFGSACEVGAIIAQQPKKISDILREFGITLGKMFQIQDDLLDYFGDVETMGKNAGGDFFEGKVTLPLILLHNKTSDINKPIIEAMIEALERNEEQFQYIKDLLVEYHIAEEIYQYLKILQISVIELLEGIDEHNEYKDYLVSLSQFIIDRTR